MRIFVASVLYYCAIVKIHGSPFAGDENEEINRSKIEALAIRMLKSEQTTQALQEENKGLKEQLTKVKTVIADQQIQIGRQRKTIDQQGAQIDKLLKTIHPKRSTDGEMDLVQKDQVKVNTVRTGPYQRKETARKYESDNGIRSIVRRLLLPPATPGPATKTQTKVAFSAHLSAHLVSLGLHHTLVFDTVDFNNGGGYDKILGVFICPVSGAYFFTATILSEQGEMVNADMVLDGNSLTLLNAGATSGRFGQATNSIVTHCNQHQRVWLRKMEAGSRLYGDGFSSFSGFLLWSNSD